MTDDDRSSEGSRVQCKLNLSPAALALLQATKVRTTWSMSTIVDMLIRAHAPMLGVSPGIVEAVLRQYESPEEAYKNAVVDSRTTIHEPPSLVAEKTKRHVEQARAGVDSFRAGVASTKKDFDFDAE